jgi:hypothetical protein
MHPTHLLVSTNAVILSTGHRLHKLLLTNAGACSLSREHLLHWPWPWFHTTLSLLLSTHAVILSTEHRWRLLLSTHDLRMHPTRLLLSTHAVSLLLSTHAVVLSTEHRWRMLLSPHDMRMHPTRLLLSTNADILSREHRLHWSWPWFHTTLNLLLSTHAVILSREHCWRLLLSTHDLRMHPTGYGIATIPWHWWG